MYFYILDIPISLAVISFQRNWSSQFLVVNKHETKHATFFAPNTFQHHHHYYNVVRRCYLMLSLQAWWSTDSPWRWQLLLFHTKACCWSLASFTPDVMQSEIIPITIGTIALGNRHKRNCLLLTSSILAYEASVAGSLYSTLQHTSTGIVVPVFPYRSPQRQFPISAA